MSGTHSSGRSWALFYSSAGSVVACKLHSTTVSIRRRDILLVWGGGCGRSPGGVGLCGHRLLAVRLVRETESTLVVVHVTISCTFILLSCECDPQTAGPRARPSESVAPPCK